MNETRSWSRWARLALAALLVPGTALARGNPGKGGGGGGRPPNAGTETVGNNLSNPAIFAEGIGITGLSSVGADPTLPFYEQPWTGLRIPADGNPTLPAGTDGTYCAVSTVPCPPDQLYYLQGTELASWQASWINGTGASPFPVDVKWGDNLFGTPWTTTSTIHVEVSMTGQAAVTDSAMIYFPTLALYGTGSTETFGTLGQPVPASGQFPKVYSESSYLLIQQLDANHVPVGTVHVLATWNRAAEGPSTSALTPEVNAGGSVVYSYNWFTGRDKLPAGWYRLTFGVLSNGGTLPGITAVAPPGNASILGFFVPSETEGGTGTISACTAPTAPLYLGCDTAANVSTLDIQLVAGSTGGGRRGSGSSSGGGGGGSSGGGH